MKSTKPHYRQIGKMQFWGPQTGHFPPPGCALIPCSWRSQTGSVTRHNPDKSQHQLTFDILTIIWNNSQSSYTRARWVVPIPRGTWSQAFYTVKCSSQFWENKESNPIVVKVVYFVCFFLITVIKYGAIRCIIISEKSTLCGLKMMFSSYNVYHFQRHSMLAC